MFRYLLPLIILAACSSPTGPAQHAIYNDPEILFHFAWLRDSTQRPYADTAIMRWYNGTPSKPDSARLLAQVEITGADTICAYFLVVSGTPLYFDLGWKRHGVTTFYSTIGPFDPKNPNNYDPFWDVGMYADTLTSTTSEYITSSPTTSYCKQGIKRDSITAAALP